MRTVVFVLIFLCVKFSYAQFPSEFNQKRGVFYNHAGNYAKAIVLCNKALADNPEYSPAYNTRANAKYKLKDFFGALKDYSIAIDLNTNDSLSYYNRGVTKVQINDYMGAERDFTRVIEISPGFKDAYICRGIIRQRLSDFSGARDDFLKADDLTASRYNYSSNIHFAVNYRFTILD